MTLIPDTSMSAEQTTLFGGDDRVDAIIRRLHEVPGWPADPTKDRLLVVSLMRQYPWLELPEQITTWTAYLLDLNSRKKVNHRARFANWCSIAARPRRSSGGSQRSHAPQRGSRPGQAAGGAPAGRDAFGDQSGYRGWS